METAPLSPLTATGVVLCTPLPALPSPSWPNSPPPHATAVPSPSSATLWRPPAAIAATPLDRPLTATGTWLSVVAPAPSWP
jgi:hypothetical protein